MKSVLLTRSQADNYDIIRALEDNDIKCNFNYISSPLVKPKNLRISSNILRDYHNIIVTSKFATKILVTWSAKQSSLVNNPIIKKNIWVVGNSSKLILEQNNFIIKYVAENVEDLIRNLPQAIYHQTIYLSANEITQELPNQIDRKIIYEITYANKLQKIKELEQGVDYILLYSQNSARTLIELLIQYNLLAILSNCLIITISKKVADIIRSFTKNVVYCYSGKTNQMLELLIRDAKI